MFQAATWKLQRVGWVQVSSWFPYPLLEVIWNDPLGMNLGFRFFHCINGNDVGHTQATRGFFVPFALGSILGVASCGFLLIFCHHLLLWIRDTPFSLFAVGFRPKMLNPKRDSNSFSTRLIEAVSTPD